jgi:hypothetical protein
MIRFPLMTIRFSIKIAPTNGFSNTCNIARQRSIIRKLRRDLPQSCECALDTTTGFQRAAIVQTLSRRKELDVFAVLIERPRKPNLPRDLRKMRFLDCTVMP